MDRLYLNALEPIGVRNRDVIKSILMCCKTKAENLNKELGTAETKKIFEEISQKYKDFGGDEQWEEPRSMVNHNS